MCQPTKWHASVSYILAVDYLSYAQYTCKGISPIKSNEPTASTANHIYNGSLFNSIPIFHKTTLYS